MELESTEVVKEKKCGYKDGPGCAFYNPEYNEYNDIEEVNIGPA